MSFSLPQYFSFIDQPYLLKTGFRHFDAILYNIVNNDIKCGFRAIPTVIIKRFAS